MSGGNSVDVGVPEIVVVAATAFVLAASTTYVRAREEKSPRLGLFALGVGAFVIPMILGIVVSFRVPIAMAERLLIAAATSGLSEVVALPFILLGALLGRVLSRRVA